MSRARRWFQHPNGRAARGYFTRPSAPRLWGCLGRFACFAPQHPPLSEHIWRMSQARRWLQHSQGGGARLWGCLRWFACLRAPHPLLSEQFPKMSQATRWLQHPKEGVSHPPVRGQFVGMPHAASLFGCLDSFAFKAYCEDVSGEALASAPQGGAARGGFARPFAPRLWGCLKRFACSVAQHLSLSEQILRMSQARR